MSKKNHLIKKTLTGNYPSEIWRVVNEKINQFLYLIEYVNSLPE